MSEKTAKEPRLAVFCNPDAESELADLIDRIKALDTDAEDSADNVQVPAQAD